MIRASGKIMSQWNLNFGQASDFPFFAWVSGVLNDAPHAASPPIDWTIS
jgi:hypothetical protein